MKEIMYLLFMDVRRIFGSIRFYLVCAGMILVQILSCFALVVLKDYSITEIFDNMMSGTCSAVLLLWMMPLVPFALSYAEDYQSNVLKYMEVRSTPWRVLTVRFVSSCLSAFLSVALSFAVFMLILHIMGHAWIAPDIYLDIDPGGYNELLRSSNAAGYLLCFTFDRGFIAAMMGACAFFVAMFTRDTFIAFSAPVCIYFLAECIIENCLGQEVLIRYRYLDPTAWMEGTYNASGGPVAAFFMKLGLMVTICGIYFLLVAWTYKRRQRTE